MHWLVTRTQLLLTLVGLALLAPGCRSTQWVAVRSTPHNALVERLKLTGRGGGKPSERTVQVLRRYALDDQLGGSQQRLLARLQAIINQESSPEKLYAFAELSYLEGKRCELALPKEALDLYEASVANAYLCLFDTRWGHRLNPYDPLFRGACDVYNGALEAALRLVGKKESLLPGSTHTIQSARQTWEVTVVARNVRWHAEDFERFEFVSDFDVAGLMNQYQTYGLGVPLIAVRKSHPEQDPSERYYPPGLSFPVTAFLRVMPECCEPSKDGQPRRALLELYDPLETTEIVVDRRRVPLESDLTTPLAYFLNKQPEAGKLATLGLLRPDKYQQLAGLYMPQPYEPDKIPVLMVHGLWSDPTTWMEMFNDLRANVDVRQNYQFWFYLYPTGQPFWTSAAQMREDLARLRMDLDPQRRYAGARPDGAGGPQHGRAGVEAADGRQRRRFLVGGEQSAVSACESQSADAARRSSGRFSSVPIRRIRRVVTIGTPHRGSDFANKYTRFLGRSLIFLPEMLVNATKELVSRQPGSVPRCLLRAGQDEHRFARAAVAALARAAHRPARPLGDVSQRRGRGRLQRIARGGRGRERRRRLFRQRTSGQRCQRADRRRRPSERPPASPGRAGSAADSAGASRLAASLARATVAGVPDDRARAAECGVWRAEYRVGHAAAGRTCDVAAHAELVDGAVTSCWKSPPVILYHKASHALLRHPLGPRRRP